MRPILRQIRCAAVVSTVLMAATIHAAPATLTLTSPAMHEGSSMPSAFVNDIDGCTGANHSPPLAWQHAPAATRSFAVSVFDTDARHGQGWWHWIAIDIPATTHSLPENASADGLLTRLKAREGQNSSGRMAYGGACPPVGDKPHHYIITVYALGGDGSPLDTSLPPAQLAHDIDARALAKATLSVTYGR